jgi:hypothetical protein
MRGKILGGILVASPLVAWSAFMIWRFGCLAFFVPMAVIAVLGASIFGGIWLLFWRED